MRKAVLKRTLSLLLAFLTAVLMFPACILGAFAEKISNDDVDLELGVGDALDDWIDDCTAHKWDSGTVTVQPSCKESGEKTYTCTVCGETYTETLDKTTEHKWDSGAITDEPTCKEEGVRTYTCTVCGATETEAVEKTEEHSWNGGEVTNEPTYREEGEKTYTCTVCGETYTEAIDKLPAILGDVNGDGSVTQLDSFYLARYIAEWEGYDLLVLLEACDLNCDGEITQMDSFILARHIAEWEGYKTLPYTDGTKVTMTYEEYISLSASEKSAFFNSFADPAGFFEWHTKAKKEYEDSQNRTEIGENGNIDLGG